MRKFGILFSLLAMTIVLATGCGRDEKQEFVDATVQSTCLFFETEDIFNPELSTKVKQVFEDHGFGTSDEELEALKNRYAEDSEVQSAILAGISKCGEDFANGVDVPQTEEDAAMEKLDKVIEDSTNEADVPEDADATAEQGTEQSAE